MTEINFFLLHVDLVVENIEREITFYKDVLGLEVLEDCVLNNEACLFLSEGKARSMRLVFLGKNKRSTMIELVQFLDDSGKPIQISHLKFKWNLSFFVDDLEDTQQHFLNKGFKPLTSQYEIALSNLGRSKVIFYQDPEGFLLEIIAPVY